MPDPNFFPPLPPSNLNQDRLKQWLQKQNINIEKVIDAITDHGKLGGLRDDDHWAYLTRDRHDSIGHRIYYDEFVDSTRVTLSGSSIQSATSPTKDASNPLFPTAEEAATAWDRYKSYTSVIKRPDGWHMFYSGHESAAADWKTGYATSTDGVTWTKPDLDLVAFNGEIGTNNILREGIHNHTIYDEYSGLFVSVEENFADNEITLWTQESPTDAPTAVKTLTPSQSNSEGKGIVRRPTDHRWIVYYNHGHLADDRSISAFISDTTELDGAWSEYGSELLSAPDQDNQYYTLFPSLIGDQILYAVSRYDKTNEQIDCDLFVSRNGIDLTKIADSWIPLGSAGSFDDEIIHASSIVEEDDEWHIYYLGYPEDHTVSDSDRRVGRATVDRERIGSVGTTGTITTDYMHVGPGAVLTINADASGGTLEIEVQDENGDAITGFDQTDFDDITTDAFGHLPTWGNETIPAGTVRLVLTLTTSVTVYSLRLTNTVPTTALASGAATLNALTDVTITSAADDHTLIHNGTAWVNEDVRSVGHYEVMMTGSGANLEPITNEDEDDWLYGWVSD